MKWNFNDYCKLAFFAFCLAFFFLILRSFFFGEVNRYRYLEKGALLDTATGAVYSIRNGTTIFKP